MIPVPLSGIVKVHVKLQPSSGGWILHTEVRSEPPQWLYQPVLSVEKLRPSSLCLLHFFFLPLYPCKLSD